LNSNAKNQNFAELIPEKSRQDAAKFLINSLTAEEKAKLFESLKNDSDKKSLNDKSN
jgi:hypothetical protein